MMNLNNPEAFTRRQFLSGGLTLAAASIAVPAFIQRSALGLPQAATGATSIPGVPEERILVVVQLSGGNDGLNTVVPHGLGEYYKARPGIAIGADKVLRLDNQVGLHPAMRAFKDLYDDGMLTVVQGVGYPNPNRSHFKSMDIWHTADTSATGDGWLGRYFDSECCGFGAGESGLAPKGAGGGNERSASKRSNPEIGIAVGREAPLAMRGRRVQPISFESADLFRWTGSIEDKSLTGYYDQLTKASAEQVAESAKALAEAGRDVNSHFLSRTALDAQVSSDLIRKAVERKPKTNYPQNNALAPQLQMVASMIHAKLRTRVYYVSLGGFDTHSGQGGENGRHANLVRQFSEGIKAFYADLKAQGNDGRVLTMVFSEFGRRVGQNGSQGTDHGTAAPMFLVGPMVQPGLATAHPSMSDLDQGDLKFGVDFRSVYAGILAGWLKADADAILEGRYDRMPVIKRG
jgi:uncharacterized protein (DUF1501 family)